MILTKGKFIDIMIISERLRLWNFVKAAPSVSKLLEIVLFIFFIMDFQNFMVAGFLVAWYKIVFILFLVLLESQKEELVTI